MMIPIFSAKSFRVEVCQNGQEDLCHFVKLFIGGTNSTGLRHILGDAFRNYTCMCGSVLLCYEAKSITVFLFSIKLGEWGVRAEL